jgi:hypothetical protein
MEEQLKIVAYTGKIRLNGLSGNMAALEGDIVAESFRNRVDGDNVQLAES